MRRAAGLLFLLLASLLAASGGAAADSGTVVLASGEVGEVRVPTSFAGQRFVYRFNVTPPGENVTFNLHYVRDGGTVTDRGPENRSSLQATYFPIRPGDVFLQFQNFAASGATLRVEWEWHYVRAVPTTRDTDGPPVVAAVAVLVLAAFAARKTAK